MLQKPQIRFWIFQKIAGSEKIRKTHKENTLLRFRPLTVFLWKFCERLRTTGFRNTSAQLLLVLLNIPYLTTETTEHNQTFTFFQIKLNNFKFYIKTHTHFKKCSYLFKSLLYNSHYKNLLKERINFLKELGNCISRIIRVRSLFCSIRI